MPIILILCFIFPVVYAFLFQKDFFIRYCVAFNGVRVASGGLDSTVRVWDAGMAVRTLSMFFLIIILTGFLYDYRMSSSSSMPSANLELSPTGTILATAVPTGD